MESILDVKSIRLSRANRVENLYYSLSSQGDKEIVEVGYLVCNVRS